ncbi:MAG TPA: D-amino-acid transaminase [Alphaproteobacteria bacterium]|nr:D-amino-acid transaminase [Alphaproteobacteria bacterium]
MAQIAYINGRYVPRADATVRVEDRGYMFGDGVYEAIAVHDGRLVAADRHFERLGRSLGELRIAWPMPRAALEVVVREVMARNTLRNGGIYIQVTRGVAPRDHKFPKDAVPSLLVIAKRSKPAPAALLRDGAAIITRPDLRWGRCDIKSLNLLPNVLAKQAAAEQNAHETWLIDAAGNVTEGSSTSAWIVTEGGALATRPNGVEILPGVTRAIVVDVARELGLTLELRAFSLAEAHRAREAFLTSTNNQVLPITRIDGKPVGDGRPGPMALRLRAAFLEATGRPVS